MNVSSSNSLINMKLYVNIVWMEVWNYLRIPSFVKVSLVVIKEVADCLARSVKVEWESYFIGNNSLESDHFLSLRDKTTFVSNL